MDTKFIRKMKPLFKQIIIAFLLITTLNSCIDICTEEYKFIIPVSVSPVKSEFKIGDTINFEVNMDRKMIYDSLNRKYFHIPKFNPHLTIRNVNINDFPTVDDIDTAHIICNSEYDYLYLSASASFGMAIDDPNIVADSIIIKCSIVLQKLGIHMLYIDSALGLLRGGIDFEGKCPDSFTDAYLPLLNENNESILSSKNKEVIDKHFEKLAGPKFRSAKFFYNVKD